VTRTVGEALRAFRAENGLCHNEREARWWIVRADLAFFPLPNFAWRRRAIDAHDVHHLLTGYPCTVEGELLIAAWEFGAGRYPHWGATLFCGPLVLAGLLLMPQRALAAWRRGRRNRSLYRCADLDRLAEMPLTAARALVARGSVLEQ
jgi:ubiquinone biosynthesis protein Coq4